MTPGDLRLIRYTAQFGITTLFLLVESGSAFYAPPTKALEQAEPLRSLWSFSGLHNVTQAIANDRQDIIIIRSAEGISAMSTRSSSLLWNDTAIGPAEVDHDVAYYFSPNCRLVARSAKNGKTLWRSSQLCTSVADPEADLSLGKMTSALIVGVDPSESGSSEYKTETTITLDAASGSMKWRSSEIAGRGRKFLAAGTTIVSSFEARGEPSFPQVDVLSQRSGKIIRRFQHYSVAGVAGGALWLAPSEDPDGYAPARYAVVSLKKLTTRHLTLSPEPLRHEVTFFGRNRYASGQPTPSAFGSPYNYVQVGSDLYRFNTLMLSETYDQKAVDKNELLVGSLGDRPILIGDDSILLLLSDLSANESAQKWERSKPGDVPIFRNKVLNFVSKQFAFIRTDNGMFVISEHGKLAFLATTLCSAPSVLSVSRLQAIMSCKGGVQGFKLLSQGPIESEGH